MAQPLVRAMPLSGAWRSFSSTSCSSLASSARCANRSSCRSFSAAPMRPSQICSSRRPVLRSAAATPTAHAMSLVPRRTYKTVEEAKSRYRSGPFSWKAGILFVVTGGGLMWYFESEKSRMQRKRAAEAHKGVGRPKVGGPFELVDQNGKTMTDADLKGRHSLVYFGFTHCPDICPEELDKMARMFDLVEAEQPGQLIPVFVTCDPARDTPDVIKEYLVEFHPSFVGLTGTYDQIKAMCKAYRVYFSTPSKVQPGQDYLVDHSIYFYLMDQEGDFVEALGRQHSPEEAAKVILNHIKDSKA